MRWNLTIVTLCFMLGMCNLAFSEYNEEAKKCYNNGLTKLKNGMDNLNKFKYFLDEKFSSDAVKISDFREKFDKDNISLSDLFDKFYYRPLGSNVPIWYEQTGYVFKKASEDFGKAIKLDDTFIEAYLGDAIAYVQVGDYQNALPVFNKAIRLIEENNKINIKEINPFSKEIQDLFCTMADEVMKRRLSSPKGYTHDEWAKKAIQVLMDWRDKYIDEHTELVSYRVNNYFEVVRFYSRHYKKEEAEVEYQSVIDKIKKMGYIPSNYPKETSSAKAGFENLQKFSFVIAEDLIKEDVGTATLRFFKDNSFLKSCQLYFYFKDENNCWVELKDEVSYINSGGAQTYYINKHLSCEIAFPQIEIKGKNKLPFYVMIDDKMPSHQIEDKNSILIKDFVGEELKIEKIKWIPCIERQTGISELFIVIQAIAWGVL